MPSITAAEFDTIIAEDLPWAAELRMQTVVTGDGTATLRVPYGDSMLRPGGTVAGPVMMALADACMYATVLAAIGPVKLAVTTSLNINFLRKPEPKDLLAHGSVLKLGKRLCVLAVDLYSDGADDLVAHATGTYSIPPR